MRPKKESKTDPNGWMNTYADMVTLLMTFFILLYAQSSPDSEKMELIINAFAKLSAEKSTVIINLDPKEPGDELPQQTGSGAIVNIGNELPFEFQEVASFLEELTDDPSLAADMQIVSGEGFVFMRFKDSIVFSPDSYVITPKGAEILEYIGTGLKAVEGQTESIRINGHTASVPSISDNAMHHRELSYRRALSVLTLFEKDCGMKPDKMIPTGYGAYRPIADSSTEEGRSQNRRVELLIMEKQEHDTDTNLADMIDLYFAGQDFLDPPSGETTP